MKITVVFYSTYGHIYQMAEAVVRGAKQVPGAEVSLYQVKELLSDEILEKMHAKEARQAFAHIPIIDPKQLGEGDAIIFGTPTRYGNVCAQMQNMMDATGQLWASGGLVGKVGSVFTSTGSQHGGQETTLTSFHTELLHHGMIIVGLAFTDKRLSTMSEITGGTPYGASTIAGGDGSRMPSENELGLAEAQGRRVAEITSKLIAR